VSRQVLLLFLMSLMSACTRFIPPPAPLSTPAVSPEEAWARVLQRAVDAQGRVNFSLLARDRTDLERYLAYVAAVSPQSHPTVFLTRWHVLAYHINTYNALAMYAVLAHHIPVALDSFPKRARFFKFTAYQIGGAKISLYDYENDVIRPLGEPRVHFALNCMATSCPRLPQVPFQATSLDQQLTDAAAEFFNSAKHVQVDTTKRIVYFSEILRFYMKDFVNAGVAPSLIAYANQYRQQPIPEEFKVAFIPYDWTIYTQ
jgi:Protein of unknown function, DUF547